MSNLGVLRMQLPEGADLDMPPGFVESQGYSVVRVSDEETTEPYMDRKMRELYAGKRKEQ